MHIKLFPCHGRVSLTVRVLEHQLWCGGKLLLLRSFSSRHMTRVVYSSDQSRFTVTTVQFLKILVKTSDVDTSNSQIST